MSPLCLGCMMFGRKAEAAQAEAMIDHAIESGINFLDTANIYSRGVSEELTGEALRKNGKRSRIVLATKVHGKMDDDDPNASGNSRRHIIDQCEQSLRRLQTDYIDLYQIHRPQPEVAIDETLRALDDLIRAGKVRYIGTSTFAAWQCVESLWAAEKLKLNRFVCEQPPYNLLDRRVERELLPMAQTFGYGIIPWSPLAGGLLTGKYNAAGGAPEGSRFSNTDGSEILKRRYAPAAVEATGKFAELAKDKGVAPSQLALAWVRDREGVTSPIIGPRTMEQLQDNLGSLDVTVDSETSERLDAIFPPGSHLSPFYQADFGPSLHSF